MDEVRLALRRVLKRPGATLASIVTLGAAIGAAAATWSLLSAVLLRPLPVSEPDRLAVFGEAGQDPRYPGALRIGQDYHFYPYLRDSGIFQDVAAGGSWSLLVDIGARAQTTSVYFASANFFDVLGVRVPIGRGFARDEDRRGAPLVAVLSDRYWRRLFGADSRVVGRTIRVGKTPATIVGVAAPGFRGLELSDAPSIYLPLNTIADVGSPLMNYFGEPSHQSSPYDWLSIVCRMWSDSTWERSAMRVASLSPPPDVHYPSQYGLIRMNTAAIPLRARAGVAQFSRLLGATVGLLLLIGCATVGMLLLVRTEARREEFAVCLALGASRLQLARGVAIEGALLALAGAVVALPIAQWLFAGVRGFSLPGGVDIGLLDLSIDWSVLAAAVACASAGTLLIAVVAGAFGFSADIADALRSRSGVTPRLARRRTRTLLVASQVAVSLVLLAGAGLFARSLIAALHLNSGFNTSRTVSGDVSLGTDTYTPAQAVTFFDDLRARLSADPLFKAVSLRESQGGMTASGRLIIDGQRRTLPSTAWFTVVDDRYFQTLGLSVIRGRDFKPEDSPHAPLVGIVSASFGRLIANGGDPLGRQITMPFNQKGQPAPVISIVGVVPDIVTNVSVTEPLDLYLPLAQQAAGTSRTIVFRAAADVTAAERDAASAIRQLDPAVVPGPMLTLDEQLSRQMTSQQFGVVVLTALGVIAVLLTVLGTYVLAESMAVMRMREMGIRAALGASGRQLGAIVLVETARLVGFGLLAGLALAWMGASTIRAFLFKVQPLDPATLGGVATTILLLALAVSLRPAWRAANVDLGTVLKEE